MIKTYDLWNEGEGYNPYNSGKNTVTINRDGQKALVTLHQKEVLPNRLNPTEWTLLYISETAEEDTVYTASTPLPGLGILQPVPTSIFSVRTETNVVGSQLLGISGKPCNYVVGDDNHNIKIGNGVLEMSGKAGAYIAFPEETSGTIGVNTSVQQQGGSMKSIVGAANFIMEHIGSLPIWNPAKFFELKTIIKALEVVNTIFDLANKTSRLPPPPPPLERTEE
jgi:hypothetical protein